MPASTSTVQGPIHDLTALRQQIMTNISLLYDKPNATIAVTGKHLLTAHVLGSSVPSDVLVSGNAHAELADAYMSLLRASAARMDEVMAKALKAKAGEKKKG